MPMQTVTKPIMLDETGQAIVAALSGLTDAVKPDAINIPYDNTDSGLISETVQGAIDENTDSISELNSRLTKYYIATADVDCTNVASNSWGYWGYTTIDLSQLLANKTLISITPQLCILKGDPAVIGLMSFTYNASNQQLIPRVNFKNSGTFSVQFLVMYR